ncbi:MAG: hypothetical protein PHQ74_14495 [Crocinitomicaceae bacterium]|nr:hypothetical protein [Crocinitomicaceae bacterium]
MKLEKILDSLNSLEKNSFIKIIDNIVSNKPKNYKEIEKIISESDKLGLKNFDNVVISKIFDLITDEFAKIIKTEFSKTSSQLDILIDILVRDGNCIMKQDWFARLYETEIKTINKKIKDLEKELEDPKSEITESRKRDYKIYKACLSKAYFNDIENNREAKITDDELSILITLGKELGLSQEEIKLMCYLILPVQKGEIDEVINELKNLGIIFYSKKTSTIYVADEMVKVLRKIRHKELADKFFRRILRTLREPQINLISKVHNIDRKLTNEQKIKEIIQRGISFSSVLADSVHKEGTNVTDKKRFLNELWEKNLNLSSTLKGSTLEEKTEQFILYFESIEKDDKVSISVDGYEKLLTELNETLPKLNNQVRTEFEIQDEKVLKSELLLDYNIKPTDILDLISASDLAEFVKARELKQRGNIVENILEAYKDSENIYLENYVNIGCRNLNQLKENGLVIKEADLGIKFEELTKSIFTQLGFNVDEKLRKELNTKKDQIDIVLNIDGKELFIVECKTVKESGYNKFSSISRQVGSYFRLAEDKGYTVSNILIVSPEFSNDFITDCELDVVLNLTLLTASSLQNILDSFKKSNKHKQFPHKLLMRDVLIQEDRIIKAIQK